MAANIKTLAQTLIGNAFDNEIVAGIAQAGTLTRQTQGTYAAGGDRTDTTTAFTLQVVFKNYSRFAVTASNGGILEKDLKAIFPPVTNLTEIVPTTDRLTVGGVDYQIIGAETKFMGSTPMMFVCQVRR